MYIIAGKYKNQKLSSPKGLNTRPTTSRLRESLFNICQNYIEDALFLDLFAGSGAMGFEALSRGAKRATFVDNNRESIQCIKQNVQALRAGDSAQVLLGDVFSIISRFEAQKIKFDIIYADPPYEQGEGKELWSQRIIHLIDKHPILNPEGYFFIEESSSLELHVEELTQLQLVSKRKMGKASLLQFKRGTPR